MPTAGQIARSATTGGVGFDGGGTDVPPGQVRPTLTAVARRMIQAPVTLIAGGFTIDFYGHQPNVAEEHIAMASLYLCTAGRL